MQVLSNRLEALGWDHRALSSPVTTEALVAMRLNALVIDVAVLGPGSWEYLERVCCAAARAAGDRLHRSVIGGPAGAGPAARRRRVDHQAVPPRRADLRDRGRGPAPSAQRDARDWTSAVNVGEITIRPDLYQAYSETTSLELTAREFEILNLLAQSDRVLRREEIYERVWGYAMAHGDRSVDVFVRKLRQKLRVASPTWSYIHTHFGVGYRFAPGATAATPVADSGPGRALDPSSIPRSPADRRGSIRRRAAPSCGRSQVLHIVVTSSVTRVRLRVSSIDADVGHRRQVAQRGASRSGRSRSCPTSISPAPTDGR